ncbi:MAG: single-stranded-DNA-specific exonuclease RecJ [bacterium]|nr:single-stranded-DNA-specific exonuclease RecJ [bacterium]
MPRPWIDPSPVTVPDEIAALGLLPLVAETLVRRGITRADHARAFLDPDHYRPADPFTLPDMERAAERIARAVKDGEHILVWGDFDVDGQTATALLVSALRSQGAHVAYHIPHREREGHGIDPNVLAAYLNGAQPPAVLLTCDTGISAHEAVRLANAHGVDVIVTDHHNLPAALPPALANINPRRLPDDHPLATLPGVGVAYQLIAALYTDHWHYDEQSVTPAEVGDLVALGIVADVAVQTGDTRFLLQLGIADIREKPRPGIAALLELARIDPQQFGEEQIGFAIAPRLNALGRLADAAAGVELLLTATISEARTRAVSVEQLNAYRKLLSDQVFAAASAQVEKDRTLLDSPVLVLGSAAWNPGVVGIVANRLVEQYNRPVFLFGGSADTVSAPNADADASPRTLKGSARSTAGIDVTEALNRTAAEQPDLLLRYGGHTMAAGVTIDAERLPDFRRAINRAIRAMGVTAPPPPALEIAGFIGLGDLTLDLADALDPLAPFGVGNPPLVLAVRGVQVTRRTTLGQSGDHLQLTVEDPAGGTARVIWWNGAGMIEADPDLLPETTVDIAFSVRARTWKGRRELQAVFIGARPAAGAAPAAARRPLDVIDLRTAADPLAELVAIQAREPALIVYAEADRPDRPGLAFYPPVGDDDQAAALVVWTAPGARVRLREVIAAVRPERVYWFAHDPGLHTPEAFTRRLAGLVKYAIERRGGRASAPDLARAMAHDAETVEAGLDWLQGQGVIALTQAAAQTGAGGEYHIERGTGRARPQGDGDALVTLRQRLAEPAAYRAYLRTADVDAIRRQVMG